MPGQVRALLAQRATVQHHTTIVGLLHPGQMGASVGASAREGGARVLWVSEDGTCR